MWDQWGRYIPVTIIQLEDSIVLDQKPYHWSAERGKNSLKLPSLSHSLVIGCKKLSPNVPLVPPKNIDNLSPDFSVKDLQTFKEKKQLYNKYKRQIYICTKIASMDYALEHIAEFPVTSNGLLPVGHKLNASHFVPGQYVDIRSKSKDKGFQGTMKRWGFKGQPQSHGTSLSHRSGGSIGQRKDPGKVWKGRKMAGHMGDEYVTTHNLQVIKVDKLLNLIYLKGSVSGSKGSPVKIIDAKFKRYRQFDPYVNPPPFPTIDENQLIELPIEQTLSAHGSDPVARRFVEK